MGKNKKPKVTVLPYSPKNNGESEDTHSPYWGDTYEEYEYYRRRGDPRYNSDDIDQLTDQDILTNNRAEA